MLYLYIVIIVFIDQFSKLVFHNVLEKKTLPIIGDFLSLRLAKNTGIAFSLPVEGMFLKIVTILLIAGIFFYFYRYEKLEKKPLLVFAYASIIGWAMSNALERLFVGYVVDFVSVKYFAIFNIADIFITIWAIILFVLYFLHDRNGRKAQ